MQAKIDASAGIVMVISIFYYSGILYQHAIQEHTTVTRILIGHINNKKKHLETDWMIHHDNERCNRANEYL